MTRHLGIVCVLLAACRDEGPVYLGVYTDPGAIADVVTDLGYEITVTELRLSLAHAAFIKADGAVGAETSETLAERGGMTYGTARPKIFGTVDAELGDYRGARFTFRSRETSAKPHDALNGHVAYVVGTASGMPFEAFIDTTDDIVLAPQFIDEVRPPPDEGTEWIGVSCAGNLTFDGIDFAALPMPAEKIEIRAGSAAHDRVREQLFVADRFRVSVHVDQFSP